MSMFGILMKKSELQQKLRCIEGARDRDTYGLARADRGRVVRIGDEGATGFLLKTDWEECVNC